jgi:hypothetical protein
MRLFVVVAQARARRFYEREGFSATGNRSIGGWDCLCSNIADHFRRLAGTDLDTIRRLPSGSRENLMVMTTTTVVRLLSEVPSLGARYAFSNGRRTFLGIVKNVVPLGERHATVTLELMASERRHLIDED